MFKQILLMMCAGRFIFSFKIMSEQVITSQAQKVFFFSPPVLINCMLMSLMHRTFCLSIHHQSVTTKNSYPREHCS